MRKSVLVVISILTVLMARSQESQEVYSFLRLPVSAHAAALGGDNITLTDDDPTLIFHNPALLNGVSDKSINLNFMTYMEGAKTASAAYIKGIGDRGTWGAIGQYMDYGTMQRSINALRPYFTQLAVMSCGGTLPAARELQQLGIDAEKTMLYATSGVNTHRGALFSMGLAVVAACNVLANGCNSDVLDQWSKIVVNIASQMQGCNDSHGSNVKKQHNVAGALDLARTGYKDASKWISFYLHNSNDEHIKHKTLLLIMCSLDDTNVIHRAGYDVAQQVKQEAAHLLENFSIEGLEQMNQRFISANISPGGAADMLSLTLFLSTLTKQDNN